jgi:hypothetical protein
LLTITNRPIGHRLNSQDVSASVIDDGQGDALVYTTSAHGLVDGDYIYIESNIDAYNGYKYVDSIAYDSFKIKDSEGGDYVLFQQDADISYRASVLTHGVQCVHLPIVYEMQSDLWPINQAEEEYIPNTIDSFENKNGYVQLNLDRALSGATALNFIELVGAGDLAGPYQILEVVQPWAIVISLAYDAGLSFTGYQVVNYYNNYNANVEVWAGLDPAHRWAAKKPYELAATLKFIPDAEGKMKFSINDILKGYIETRNNLTLDTLPNNLDFHVSFYIKFFESYDLSDGETIETEEGDVTTDTFEGMAVNAMLPFKSLNSGHLSEYVNQDTSLARWLTLFDRPLAIVDRFFDISFINQFDEITIIILRNGELFQTIVNPGSGVIRVMFIPEAGFTEYCLQAKTLPFTQNSVPPLSEFTQQDGTGDPWTLGAIPNYSASGDNLSDVLRAPYPFVAGLSYEFNYDFDVTLTGAQAGDTIRIGSGRGLEDGVDIPIPSSGNYAGTVIITPTINRQNIGIQVTGTPSSINVDVNVLTSEPIEFPGFDITEVICIDITQECEGTFVNDRLRLTEPGQFRELE